MAKSVQPRPLAAAARLPRRSEPPDSSRPSRRRYRPRMGTLTSGFEAAGVRRNRWGSGTTRHYKPGATDAQRILVRAVGTQIKKIRRPIGLQRGGEGGVRAVRAQQTRGILDLSFPRPGATPRQNGSLNRPKLTRNLACWGRVCGRRRAVRPVFIPNVRERCGSPVDLPPL